MQHGDEGEAPAPLTPVRGAQPPWFTASGPVTYAATRQAPVRRRWPIWLAATLAAAFVLCSAPVAFVIGRAAGRALDGAAVAGSRTTPAASPTPARSPVAGDPDPVRQAWLRDQINSVLAAQSHALLRGDEKAYLAVAEPGAKAVTAALSRRYRSLRALHVTGWRATVSTGPIRISGAGGRTEWRVWISQQHCFVIANCQPDPVTVGTRWAERSGRPVLVGLDTATSTDAGPRPWEVSALKAAVGRRVMVATTAQYAGRLPALLRAAEAAAVVADRYAIGGTPPDRYRVFFAGRSEWGRWYGGRQPEWSAGIAIPIGPHHFEVVLNAADISASFLDDILRHELTHVATLPAGGYDDSDNWWLVEGIADYAEMDGGPVSHYDNLPAVRRFLDEGDWDGDVAIAAPARRSSEWEVGARYGIGFLAVRCLADRYGEPQLLSFFAAVVRDRKPLRDASRTAFGDEWSTVRAGCAAFVRSMA